MNGMCETKYTYFLNDQKQSFILMQQNEPTADDTEIGDKCKPLKNI